jgi:HEAT repeat protein
LRLATIDSIADELSALAAEPVDDYATATARDCLAFHRRPVVVPVAATFDALPEDVAWLTAEARGRSGTWDAALIARLVSHPSPAVKGSALKNAARSGFRGVLDFCRSAPDEPSMRHCIEFLGVVGTHDDLPRLQRLATGGDSTLARSAIVALGKLGLVAALPTLLYLLDESQLAKSAATAIERISGEHVPRGAAPPPPENLSEEELDVWEPEAPIDVGAAREWWSSRAPHFDPKKRYQAGVNVTDDALGSAFDQLPQRLRRDVYLRERALAKNAPDWELDTWPRRQRNPSA